MNFYPHHISDFNNDTRHLTRVERSVYRDAIELYYDTESVLTSDFEKLAKRLLCFSQEEKAALKDVLDEYFDLHGDGYFHERCDDEIAKYRANISAKARAGIASAKARKQKAAERKHKSTRVKSSSTPVHNQEPLTNNQEPIKPLCDDSHDELELQRKKQKQEREQILSNAFDFLWKEWPNSKQRKIALKAFEKIIKNKKPESIEDLVNHFADDISRRVIANDLGFSNMNMSTYFNQERWTDDISGEPQENFL